MKPIKIACALALMLCVFALVCVSCTKAPVGGGKASDIDNGGVGESQNADGEKQTAIVGDDLPGDLDYGGYGFDIYTRENTAFYQYIIEEEIGEILNDAVYKRTRNVEDRLNVAFGEVVYSGNADAPRKLLLSGDNT